MRRILIENAHKKGRQKRGGGWRRVELDRVDLAAVAAPDQLLALDEAIQKLASEDATAAELVKIRYFAGLSVAEAGKMLGISVATAYRHWSYARAWLHCELLRGES